MRKSCLRRPPESCDQFAGNHVCQAISRHVRTACSWSHVHADVRAVHFKGRTKPFASSQRNSNTRCLRGLKLGPLRLHVDDSSEGRAFLRGLQDRRAHEARRLVNNTLSGDEIRERLDQPATQLFNQSNHAAGSSAHFWRRLFVPAGRTDSLFWDAARGRCLSNRTLLEVFYAHPRTDGVARQCCHYETLVSAEWWRISHALGVVDAASAARPSPAGRRLADSPAGGVSLMRHNLTSDSGGAGGVAGGVQLEAPGVFGWSD